MSKKLINSKDYQENWKKIFSEEAKLKAKELEEELLEKERLYGLELKKKEDLLKEKEKRLEIKVKIKKIL